MLRRLAAASCFMAWVTALPTTSSNDQELVQALLGLKASAPPCTGAGDPKKVPTYCYNGSASVLGGVFTENVVIQVNSFTEEHGSLDIYATGAAKYTCINKTFSKAGQNITVDFAGCVSSAPLNPLRTLLSRRR
jgi:hypothetical protein